MKKVLYISNIEVPYRVRFFNELAKNCDLTVLYERKKSSNRNPEWAKSESGCYRTKYLRGWGVSRESAFSLGILKEIFLGYDAIIVGCYNSPAQMLAILAMRLFRLPYIVNVDGEVFLRGNSLKTRLKRFFLSGAKRYLVAGEQAALSLKEIAEERVIIPYYFSSLSEQELAEHRHSAGAVRNDTILVVGQYFDYKGLDVALKAAQMDSSLRYKFVGLGNRTELFQQTYQIPPNVELIPFLQKQELEDAYKHCAMLLLPSRQECWGLVINEAASFGMPIVSTWGSGAAVEFLAEEYPWFLAKPGDAEDLFRCIKCILALQDTEKYRGFLLKKSENYSIEHNVQAHLDAIG